MTQECALITKTPPLLTENVIEEAIDVQLIAMDALLADPKADFRTVLEQAYKILMLMSHRLRQTNRTYVLDQEPQLFAQVNELKETYNSWGVLAITIASGTLTIAGGLVGAGAAIPGTGLGQSLANSAPNALGWLSSESSGKMLTAVGGGIGSVGQGTGAFGKIGSDSNESRRTYCNVLIEEIKRKRSDRDDSARQNREQCSAANSSWHQALEASHQACMQVLQRS